MLLPVLAQVFGTVFHARGYKEIADWAHGVDDIQSALPGYSGGSFVGFGGRVSDVAAEE